MHWIAVLALLPTITVADPTNLSGRSKSFVEDEIGTCQTSKSKQRANAVKKAFEFAWDGYYQYAFPNDELHPVSNTSGNSR
jgi:hypothetical protein